MKRVKVITSLFLVLFLISGCKNNEKVEENKQNPEQKQVESNVRVEDFQFQLLNAKLENGTTEFEFEITNISDELKNLKEFKVTVKDESGNDLVTLTSVINKELASKDKLVTTCSYGGDLANYNSFEYELTE